MCSHHSIWAAGVEPTLGNTQASEEVFLVVFGLGVFFPFPIA